MVSRGEHNRRSDQASLVPSPPFDIPHQKIHTVPRYAARALRLARPGIHFRSAGDPSHTEEGIAMPRPQRSGAVHIPARWHPACLPRAELPEAG